MKSFVFLILMCISVTAFSQDGIFGQWKTIDDDTGKEKSIVEIFEKDGEVFGRIIELLNPEVENPTCDKCRDERKDQPILGLEIIRSMENNGDEWTDGTILDPENGKTYDCKIWVEDGKLQVRGYVGFFFRTQEWIRG